MRRDCSDSVQRRIVVREEVSLLTRLELKRTAQITCSQRMYLLFLGNASCVKPWPQAAKYSRRLQALGAFSYETIHSLSVLSRLNPQFAALQTNSNSLLVLVLQISHASSDVSNLGSLSTFAELTGGRASLPQQLAVALQDCGPS